MRLEDTYLHVPGYHPSSSDSSVFRQRPDDPTVLPSLHRHHWGHLLALGNLTLKIEKLLAVEPASRAPKQQEKDEVSSQSDEAPGKGRSVPSLLKSGWDWKTVLLMGEPATITGEGSSLMVEWSTSIAVALLRTVQHLQQRYKLFGTIKTSADGGNVAEDGGQGSLAPTEEIESDRNSTSVLKTSDDANVFHHLGQVALSFRFTDANAFVYGLTPGTVHTFVSSTSERRE